MTLTFLHERAIDLDSTTLSVPMSAVEFPVECEVPMHDGSFEGGRIELQAKDLFLVLDVDGDLAYADMIKSGLTFAGDKMAREAVVRAVEGSLVALHTELQARCGGSEHVVALFAPRKTFNDQILLHRSIPCVARNLERMIRSVGNQTRDDIIDALGLGIVDTTDIANLNQEDAAVTLRLRYLLARAYENENAYLSRRRVQ